MTIAIGGSGAPSTSRAKAFAGVSPSTLQDVDLCVEIPVYGMANSLNVAMAFALVAYEASRQHRGDSEREREDHGHDGQPFDGLGQPVEAIEAYFASKSSRSAAASGRR